MRFARLGWLVLLILCSALLLTLSPQGVLADGLVVSPPNGLPGTTFQIQGGGFSGNEKIAVWAQFPDGHTEQLGNSQADGSGSFTFQLSTDSTFSFGTYRLLGHGQSSGRNDLGALIIGSAGSGGIAVGTATCSGQSFTVSGFASGEQVLFTAQLPNGGVQSLGNVTADGSGNATLNIPLTPSLPQGTYVITGLGLTSGHQTSDTLTFDGSTLAGGNCTISISGGSGITPTLVPRSIVNYRGAGVYLNTNPNQLYYFGCDWKWVQISGPVYFLVLGFRPNEGISYLVQDFNNGSTLSTGAGSADGYGNYSMVLNGYTLPNRNHIHVWFYGQSSGATYCGHFDNDF